VFAGPATIGISHSYVPTCFLGSDGVGIGRRRHSFDFF
jgi:hypothetical protein